MDVKLVGIFLVFLFLGGMELYGQESENITGDRVVSGVVRDSVNGEYLYGVNVFVVNENTGTSTDERGRFQLRIPRGNQEMRISHIGYDAIVIPIEEGIEYTAMEILLGSSTLKEVHIVAEKQVPLFRKSADGNTSIPIDRVTFLPSFSGYPDLVKSAAFLPGIASSRDGLSQLVIRGNEYDQNALYIDGVPIHQYNHLFGLMSSVNTDVVQDFSVLKSYKPLHYDHYLGSALDVKISGGSSKTQSSFTVGVLNSGYKRSGKLGKGTYNTGIRVSYFDLVNVLKWIKTLRSTSGQTYDWTEAADWTFKTVQPFLGGEISATTLLGFSNYGFSEKKGSRFREENKTTQQNRIGMATVQSKHLLNEKIELKNQLYYSFSQPWTREFESLFDVSNSSNDTLIKDVREDRNDQMIHEWGVRSIVELDNGTHTRWRAGLEYISSGISTRRSFLREEYDDGERGITRGDFGPFAQNNQILSGFLGYKREFRTWRLKGGVRFNHYSLQNTSAFLPRLSLQKEVSKRWNIYANYFASAQDRHTPYGNILGTQYPRWILRSAEEGIATSKNVSVGSSISLDNGIVLNGEVFYTFLDNLVYYTEDNSSLYSSYKALGNGGTGESFGLELQMARAWENKMNLQFAYTLMKTERQYPNLNNGNPFPSDFGRNHDLKIQFMFPFRKLLIGTNWQLASGFPFTVPESYVNNSDFPSYTYISSINNFKLPMYHRLDISINRSFKSKKGRRSVFSLNIFNAYYRLNADHIRPDPTTGTLRKTSNFGIVPSFYYKIYF